MPRLEIEIMNGWKFALNNSADDHYKEVSLPHDWAITAPFNKEMDQGEAQGFRDRWGIGWYKRVHRLDNKREGYRFFLDFGGIYENSTVWVNGKEVGGHKYGYSSFRLDITDMVIQGENQLLIKVDNTAKPSDRWYSGAGIYRTVKWIEVEEKHFNENDIIVQSTIFGSSAKVAVHTGMEENIKAVLSDNDTTLETESKDGEILFSISSVKLWSAENPNLYRLTLHLMDGERVADTVSMKIGIRDILMIAKKGMIVNGKRVILKGVCLHQDVGCRGIAAKPEIWKERLLNLKEMGCNAIRAAHHTFAVEFLDLCDEMGFYVYEECFDKWTAGMYGRYFESEWKKDVESMVKRDRNRACIFIWGVGNEVENQAQDSMLSILKRLKENVLTVDSSRPVTYAMNPHFKREKKIELSEVKDIQRFVDEVDDTEIYDQLERIERIKKIADVVDVIACNYQEQWYNKIHQRIPNKLILGSETYEYFTGHPNQMQNFTCENPALEPYKNEYVIGGMIWTGIDYLGESMGYPSKGWSGALIRTNGERRPGYYIMQSYWSDRPMVHFSVMDYSLEDEGVKSHWDMPIYADHWHFPQFNKTVIPYMITSNCEEVKLFLNDKQIYVPRPVECPNRLITGFIPWVSGCVKVVGFRNGHEVCSYKTVTPGPAVKLEFERKTMQIEAVEGYEVMLTVSAKDEQGNPYFRESSMVRFRLEGEAGIIAVDNGNLKGNEPYNENFIHMYHGKASVMIRISGKPGRIAVYADAEGMHSGMAVIYVGQNM